MVLRCFVLLEGGGRFDADVQVSAELTDDALEEDRGKWGGAAAFVLYGDADEFGGGFAVSLVEGMSDRGQPAMIQSAATSV